MSDDLIKRKSVIATIEAMFERCTTYDIIDYKELMLEAVKVLPSAYFKDGHGWCEWHINETKADDFCSYGSSSEKANNSKVSEKPTGSERSSE